jgi:two-component system, NarL family, response regulator NreC
MAAKSPVRSTHGPQRRKDANGSARQIWSAWHGREPLPRCRVVLVDDHVVVRDGIAALLQLESDLEIVGCAGDVETALELVRDTLPGLVICDLNLPGLSGGQAVQAIRTAVPKAAILVLTAHDSLEYVRAAFIGGAIGYVSKDAPRSELLRAVRRAAGGRRTVCGNVWDAVVGDWLEHCLPPEPAVVPGTDLDDEARQVLRYIALGVPTWRIAQDLGRGVKAVEKYRTTLMRRLGLRSAAAVTRFAVDNRLVSSLELDHMLEVREA